MRLRLALVFGSLLAAAAGSCRWSEVPGGAVYACDSSGACPDGHACDAGYCFPIPAVSCAPAAAAAACLDAGVQCGDATLADGCGTLRVYACGDGCGDGGVCRANLCCQLPTAAQACADAGHACGPLEFKACGRSLAFECGSCVGTDHCTIAETGASCEPCVPETDATFCNRLGATCGALSGADNCGAARSVTSCGTCADGGCGSAFGPNLCACQPNLSGCTASNQCCTGTCGDGGICCAPPSAPCVDESDCCVGACAQGFCEAVTNLPNGRP